MASSKDYEKIMGKLKTIDVSIVDYCLCNVIICSLSLLWYIYSSLLRNGYNARINRIGRQDYIDQISDLKTSIRRLLEADSRLCVGQQQTQ